MCGRYAFNAEPAAVQAAFTLAEPPAPLTARYNVAPPPPLIVSRPPMASADPAPKPKKGKTS